MKGKNVLITGATSGIGKATATEIVRLGANIIIVGRNREKTENVVAELKSLNNSPHIDYFLADLSSMNETKKLAESVKNNYNHLDVLINNAGLIMGERQTTTENYEYTFALDHLSPFLLTGMLLELLVKSPSARIITVSSLAHVMGKIHFNDLMLENGYSSFKAYSQAKLANILFAYELSGRLNGYKITSNSLHPGLVSTNFGKNSNRGFTRMVKIGRYIMISAEKGAKTSVYLASSPEVEGISGKYFVRKKPAKTYRYANNQNIAKKLWEVSEHLTDFKYKL